MNYALTMIICSIVFAECTDPHIMDKKYDSYKECLIGGYEESIKKIEEIELVNKHLINVKFNCKPTTRA
jgi:hypothetical protein